MHSSICSVVVAEPLTVAELLTVTEPVTVAELATVTKLVTVLDALEPMFCILLDSLPALSRPSSARRR